MDLKHEINVYFEYCEKNKGLSDKTLKAYGIDLRQFSDFYYSSGMEFGKAVFVKYIGSLNRYKTKTIKRKIASLKAFCSYMEYEDIIKYNPFHKIKTKLKEPVILPKTIPVDTLTRLFRYMYTLLDQAKRESKEYLRLLRDITAIELLFSTGARISEICSLRRNDVSIENQSVKIYGKGSRERIVYIGSSDVINIINIYLKNTERSSEKYLFFNRLGKRFSEQSLRYAIYNYVKKAGITQHITPHMFRHSFATMMLDKNVDIRYIQNILGHSSITTTQIYTHVSVEKQREIMIKNNPRNTLSI